METPFSFCAFPPNAVYATAFTSSLLLFFSPTLLYCLVEEANDLSRDVLATGLFVVHDTGRGGQNHVAELTRGQQTDGPLLKVGQLDVVAGRNNTSLVEAVKLLDANLNFEKVIRQYTYRPMSWTTILPERWSSTSSNSPMYPEEKPRNVSKCCERLNIELHGEIQKNV